MVPEFSRPTVTKGIVTPDWRSPDDMTLWQAPPGCQLLSAALVRLRVCRQVRLCLPTRPSGIRTLTALWTRLQPATSCQALGRRWAGRWACSSRKLVPPRPCAGSAVRVRIPAASYRTALVYCAVIAVLAAVAAASLIFRGRPPAPAPEPTAAQAWPPAQGSHTRGDDDRRQG